MDSESGKSTKMMNEVALEGISQQKNERGPTK